MRKEAYQLGFEYWPFGIEVNVFWPQTHLFFLGLKCLSIPQECQKLNAKDLAESDQKVSEGSVCLYGHYRPRSPIQPWK